MEQSSPYKIYIKKEIPILLNLPDFYRKSDGAKKNIHGCIFAEKLLLKHSALGTEHSVTETFCDYQIARPQDKNQ